MSKTEGTIQFAYQLTHAEDVPMGVTQFANLAAWRSILFELQLLGQMATKYEGFAFGNISVRCQDAPGFIITASQTSGETQLHRNHLVHIKSCNLPRFWVDASGQEPPSSESLTHAMIYAADANIKCIFHAHNQVIWENRTQLNLPETAADVGYGSPQMAEAVRELMQSHPTRPLTFATAGHEDGLFACGQTPHDSGGLLVNYLAQARSRANGLSAQSFGP